MLKKAEKEIKLKLRARMQRRAKQGKEGLGDSAEEDVLDNLGKDDKPDDDANMSDGGGQDR